VRACHSAIWQLPPRARRYVLVVDLLALGCLAVLAVRSSWRIGDFVTAAVFVACGELSIEVFRRTGAPPRRKDRPHHNLIGAFLFPVALVLPPIYVGLMAIPLHAFLQIRMTRLPMVKRTFNAAAAVLYSVAAALVYDRFAPRLTRHELLHVATPGAIAALLLAIAVFVGLNKALMMGIVRRVAPATPWPALLGDAESWALSAGDVCAGVILALAWAVSPYFILFALIPILLLQRAVVHTHLVAASRHDAKTGLANPSWWRYEAGRAVTRAQHGGPSVAVVIFDVDRFKTVNDRHGHLFGDAVLAAVADTLRIVVRAGDLVGRFGGDEFSILLNGVDETQAMATAERLRHRLAILSYPLLDGQPPLHVTASLGVAVFGPERAGLDELLTAADRAMYKAKAKGRNCVCLADAVPLPAPQPIQLI
jgi:diguanylate cyclase (GGDEF)-like protein